jgi:hypothetical protein
MNFEKTKVVWFGFEEKPKEIYMKDLNLQWNPHTFRILGIEFTSDLRNITDINIEKQFTSMSNIIRDWSLRHITPIGKTVILKSLVLPKIIHILTSLPEPSKHLIKKIETLFFKYIWNNGPDKIKRETLCQSKDDGGLAMLDLRYFIKALKITWIRRIHNCKSKWKEIVNDLYKEINYTFWISIYKT